MMLAERMDLLTKRPQGTLFPPAQNRAAWEALPADDRTDIETFIAKWRGTPYPMLLLSDYAAFVRTGSRAQCETPYFARRRKCPQWRMACGASARKRRGQSAPMRT